MKMMVDEELKMMVDEAVKMMVDEEATQGHALL